MTNISSATVRFQNDRTTIEAELAAIQSEWTEQGIETKVLDEQGDIDPDAEAELLNRFLLPTLVAKVVLDTDDDKYRVDVMVDDPEIHDVRAVHDVESGDEADAWTLARELADEHGYRLAEPNEA